MHGADRRAEPGRRSPAPRPSSTGRTTNDLHHRDVPGPALGRRPLPEIAREFTGATRSELGCLWFHWSRSLEDPTEHVLVEAFRDGDAGAAHVQSDHFEKAQQTLPPHLAETPRVVHFDVPQDGWSELGELAVEQ